MPFPVAAGDTVLASDINAIVPDGVTAFASYTPVLTATTTNPTLGTGSVQVGRYYRVGKLVVVHGRITFGTSGVGNGSGGYYVSLPVATTVDYDSNALRIGVVNLYDSSANTHYIGAAAVEDTTKFHIASHGMAGIVDHDSPFFWSTNDWLLFQLAYQAA